MTSTSPSPQRPLVFDESFDGGALNRAVWLPHYLPAWSSLAATAASYELRESCLHLRIPADHPLWLPGEHTPLRVSALQSGNFSGAVGSTVGQQPAADAAVVREAQHEFWGRTPRFGYLEMRARAVLTAHSMVAWWLVGLETSPEQSAEICIAEIFGNTVVAGSAANVGSGLHPFRDPRVAEDFDAPRVEMDVAEFHRYAVDWDAQRVRFYIDGQLIRECANPPRYAMQHMIAVFDFPAEQVDADEPDGATGYVTPEFIVDYVREYGAPGAAGNETSRARPAS